MPDTEPLKQALVDACIAVVQAGQGAAQAALATAGLITEEQYAQASPGLPYPAPNITQAASLASQAQQTMAAAESCAQALAALEERFPTPPPPPPSA